MSKWCSRWLSISLWIIWASFCSPCLFSGSGAWLPGAPAPCHPMPGIILARRWQERSSRVGVPSVTTPPPHWPDPLQEPQSPALDSGWDGVKHPEFLVMGKGVPADCIGWISNTLEYFQYSLLLLHVRLGPDVQLMQVSNAFCCSSLMRASFLTYISVNTLAVPCGTKEKYQMRHPQSQVHLWCHRVPGTSAWQMWHGICRIPVLFWCGSWWPGRVHEGILKALKTNVGKHIWASVSA